MHFAIVKLSFEAADKLGANDRKALHSLCEKIRSRYKVSVAACEDGGSGADAIAIAALASSEEKLTQLIDTISEFCETSGFGRVESEDALMDHIDAVADYATAD